MSIFFNLNAFSDTTWASIQLMAWTVAEPGSILICACMPALWPMVLRMVPGIGARLRSSIENSNTHSTDSESKHRSVGGRRSFCPNTVLWAENLSPLQEFVDVEICYQMGETDEVQVDGKINVRTEVSWSVEPSQNMASESRAGHPSQ